jgi:tRNA1(Val) A37 N6-methylase TrmN6
MEHAPLFQPEELTLDKILGGRVGLYQPATGYRVAIDPVFLAASIPCTPADTILDVGMGVGAASLCLAARVPGCKVIGLELQRPLVRLAAQNIELNHLKGRVEVLQGSLTQPPPRLAPSSLSHVMANPPYYQTSRGTPSPSLTKQLSNSLEAGLVELKSWVQFACLMVRPQGTVTFIYPAELMDQLLVLLYGKLGHLTICPLWAAEGRAASRVLIRGVKNVNGPSTLCPGLTLHGPEGKYTPTAEGILRHAQPLVF